jgi:hypothetical protein
MSFQINNLAEFKTHVASLVENEAEAYSGTLEEYLRSVWSLIQENASYKGSYGLFAEILTEAFSITPPPFDESWLKYKSPPRAIGNPSTVKEKDEYRFIEELILYQIADLHLMEQAGILKQPESVLSLGIASLSYNSWSNIHPQAFLEGAISGFSDNNFDGLECNWRDLALFLWLGQIYE